MIQLSLDEAMQAREQGQDRAIAGADGDYRSRLWDAIEGLAAERQPFTGDDVRLRVGDPPAGYSPNVIGAMFSAANGAGLIRCIGLTRSRQKQGHGNRIAIWMGES